jgi:glycosyltransferase involved in cell wall biosynthesis
MNNVTIIIICPTDPVGQKVGGGEVFLKGFIKYAPENYRIKFVGINSSDFNLPNRKWSRLKIGNNTIDFFPLFRVKDENKKTLLPLSLKFTLFLLFCRLGYRNCVILFNRIEPAILFLNSKIPKVAIVHNDIEKQIFSNNKEVYWSRVSWLYSLVERLIFSSLDKIFSVSQNSLRLYYKKYPQIKDKFCFIPTWVDIDLFYRLKDSKGELRKRIITRFEFLNEVSRWILFVGRLQFQKCPLRLIEVFYEYVKFNKSAILIIIGEGNLRQETVKLIKKLFLQDKVFLLGRLGQEDLINFYNSSDLLLLVSDFEGMPICILESLICGLPVVSTDVGEVKNIVKNGYSGEVVSSTKPIDIANSVVKVLENSSVYSAENCIHCVEGNVPRVVLEPLYREIKTLNNKYVI